ncbi:glutathione S-transferase family protein [Psychromonas ossibalaenae]|uniref:glutathione S-transferase family protein n=1 Tax=Psychromonas ossibalaenae TaxID=444922 RepID=UPI00036A5F4E|nr:glutathione S-transferase family protein [Psychromonas ossibalaenae]
MLILKQTQVQFDGINASPFCAKLELFLTYFKIPFKIEAALPMHGPHKKIPFVEYQGETLGDSELILQRLIKDYKIEQGLTDMQISQGIAWQAMLEQHLYWIMVYNRWVPEQSWKILENAFFSQLRQPLRAIIARQSRKLAKKNLYAQGIGRFNLEQLLELAEQDLKALNVHLADNAFICGEVFSHFDLFAYALIKNINSCEINTPLSELSRQFKELCRYQQRVEAQLAPGCE